MPAKRQVPAGFSEKAVPLSQRPFGYPFLGAAPGISTFDFRFRSEAIYERRRRTYDRLVPGETEGKDPHKRDGIGQISFSKRKNHVACSKNPISVRVSDLL